MLLINTIVSFFYMNVNKYKENRGVLLYMKNVKHISFIHP